MRRGLFVLAALLVHTTAWAQGPLANTGAREVARLVSDGALTAGIAGSVWEDVGPRFHDHTKAIACTGMKTLGGFGLAELGQHVIHSPRPSVATQTGNGMPSGHATTVAAAVDWRHHPIASAIVSFIVYAGRTLSGEHTDAQALAGVGIGAALSLIPCPVD